MNARWFFVFGFEKAERANVTAKELAALQNLAADLLKLGENELTALVESDALQEICDDDEN
jgi:hypothetical protein